MTKLEFESMAMRNNETISNMLYDTIERFYMSENDYHKAHGGVNETKQEFVKRVFDGKVNTIKTISIKILKERIVENTFCLQSISSVTKKRLDEMNALLAEQTAFECYENCGSQYQTMKEILKKSIK